MVSRPSGEVEIDVLVSSITAETLGGETNSGGLSAEVSSKFYTLMVINLYMCMATMEIYIYMSIITMYNSKWGNHMVMCCILYWKNGRTWPIIYFDAVLS